MATTTHGRYSVTMGPDGAINVKPGDRISEYSAAIHKGDMSRIHEYGRLQGGKVIPLPHPNQIRAGETIYHIPTHRAGKAGPPTPNLLQETAKDLVLVLHGLIWLSGTQRSYTIEFITRDLKPLVEEAGRRLVVKWGSKQPPGELNVYFEKGQKPEQMCGFDILGDANSGYVSIAGHLHLRVCGPSHPGTGKRDTRRVLSTDRLFCQALANTALHELGHFIADLQDNRIPGNIMSTLGPKGGQKTLEAMRQFFGSRQWWTQQQREQLVSSLRTGVYLGDSLKIE